MRYRHLNSVISSTGNDGSSGTSAGAEVPATSPVAEGNWTAVVSAQFGNSFSGQVFIMRESGTNTTIPIGGNLFGSSVAISSDYAFVGNLHHDSNNTGRVVVFNKDTGHQVAILYHPTSPSDTNFGGEDIQVSATGNRVAIPYKIYTYVQGSTVERYGYNNIQIMDYDGSNRVDIFHPDFDVANNYLNMTAFAEKTGWTETKFVASARAADVNGTDSGSVFIYDPTDGSLSTRLDGATAGDKFGYSVATQANFNRVLVGSPGWNNNAGRVILYNDDGTEVMTIERPTTRSDAEFGRNVAYGSGRIVIGEKLDTSVGYIHIFDEVDGSHIQTISGPRTDNYATGDLDVAGNYIFVSSSGYNSNNGAFWVYDLDGNGGTRYNNPGTSGFAHFGNRIQAIVG
jgi:hypothetical protein